MLTVPDNYRPSVVADMRKSRCKWYQVSRILGWEGVDTRTSGNFYKVVVQVVLLFGSEIWVMTPWVGLILGGFHNMVALRLVGIKPQ